MAIQPSYDAGERNYSLGKELFDAGDILSKGDLILPISRTAKLAVKDLDNGTFDIQRSGEIPRAET